MQKTAELKGISLVWLISALYTIALACSASAATTSDTDTCTTVPVKFRVMNADTIAGQNIYVNGDQPALGNWTANIANVLKAEGDGANAAWSASIQLPPSTPIQFKFFKHGGANDIWEGSFQTDSGNRQAVTQACGAPALSLDVGSFVLAETDRSDFLDTPGAPKGVIGAHLRALVATINANDPIAVYNFLEKHTSAAYRNSKPLRSHEKQFADALLMSSGLDFRAMRTYHRAIPFTTAILQDRGYGRWASVSVEFEEGGERRINRLEYSPARPPKAAPHSETKIVAEIRALVDRGCRKDIFSGTMLIAHDNRVLLEKACGEASKRYHVRNNIDTKFNLGSMNKMFTAVAITQLIEQGRLSYDDPVSRFVDESWLPKEITDKITIRHLLTHTSGLGSYLNERFFNSSRLLFRDLNDYKMLVQGDKPAFTPGDRFAYSNTGMLLLGVVIEKVTGQNYFDYVRAHIYVPAGMRNTDSYAMDDPVENLAMGYVPAPEKPTRWTNNSFMHVVRGGPAGGGYSTVRDLNRFAAALQQGKLVKPESLKILWRDHVNARYGHGFQVKSGSSGKVVGHSGGFPGVNGQLDIHLDRGYVVVVLSNHSGGASPLADRIGELIGQLKVH